MRKYERLIGLDPPGVYLGLCTESYSDTSYAVRRQTERLKKKAVYKAHSFTLQV